VNAHCDTPRSLALEFEPGRIVQRKRDIAGRQKILARGLLK
jgi:hypothetical protein